MFARPILLLAAALAAPLFAQIPQDSVESEAPAPAIIPGDALSIARAAATRGDQAEALSQYLRVLSTSPNNVEALAGAGRAALAVGDVNAATGFFARAEDLAPNDGAVKAGLGSATVQTGNGRAALRYFKQALSLGVAEASLAEDRGLAYDLTGDSRRAQASYQLALLGRPGDPTTTRRLALSQAISGNLPAALTTLDPLLRKQDIPAWRTRAFAKAVTGDVAGAEQDAAAVLPANQVATLRPYLARIAALKPSEKAAAVFLGRFPQPANRTLVAKAIPPAPRPVVTPSRTVIAAATPLRSDFALAPSAATPAPQPEAAPPLPATVDDSPALRAQRRAVAAANAKDLAAKRAEALAAQKKKADQLKAAAEAKASRSNPARHWVQVAGGANKADLPRAWTQLKAKWPGQLGSRSPWTMHYRFTNRLLIGPFPTADAAQDWVGERKKEGMTTFRVSTKSGEAVEKL
ncbi:SPOR domain-containing protein [Sphingomonas sp. BIUV-7]|uniref:SPOR domain-containing protein n=1 Tax=Sphingomonas natans TaxID=3063330 RepID=A0ABT8Y583_9SPHN|nr:SPOR domain-containing protein [Sphingomonas sp. BIUV-7]MDO6413479.1 SPOR domain-containing protein [Sphingomonas sp. BIUV-7]